MNELTAQMGVTRNQSGIDGAIADTAHNPGFVSVTSQSQASRGVTTIDEWWELTGFGTHGPALFEAKVANGVPRKGFGFGESGEPFGVEKFGDLAVIAALLPERMNALEE